MKFHLNYKPKPGNQKITHKDSVLLIGSCFSEHIGWHLKDLKFKTDSNPFGIVFNPKSIETLLLRIITRKYFIEKDIFEKENQWFCLDVHSSISAKSNTELLSVLNSIIDDWNQKLATANYLIITFGSAFAYEHKDKKAIVANCHKLPGTLFEKIVLDNNGIINDYEQLINELNTFNPGLRIIFTVSPVKHLRDGVEENSLSKSILIQTVHKLVNKNSNCFYFSAYELVTDDLRDYRFYEADMAHPNKQAIDYVWHRFSEVYFNDDTMLLNEKLKQIDLAMKHRLFNESSESSLRFKKDFYQKCKVLQKDFSFLDLNKEIEYFSSK